ncbi:MAG: signal peptidase I [Lachnospiraceae bacterium]|nr:signal peptidase I [Lachnospiraceae bacterium]
MRTFIRSIIASSLLMLLFCIFINFFQITIVSGYSMAPTLKNKQIILVDKKEESFEKEDIITFRTNQYGICVKRIVGTAGDTIKLENGKVYRNNIELSMYSCDANQNYEVLLEKNQFFVMGDNVNDSIDSRNYGPIDISTIIGVAKCY